jgi:hypothetical protein
VIDRRFVGGPVGVFALAALAASAWAQDYTVTTATNQLEARPNAATAYNITSSGDDTQRRATATLPFDFPYYGSSVREITISAAAFIVPRSMSSIVNQMYITSSHGQDATSGAFPYSEASGGGSGDSGTDGVIAALWHYLHVNDSLAPAGRVYTWTTGAAPNRHFVVSWDNAKTGIAGAGAITVQIQLYEGTGRVCFAYSSGTYPSSLSGGYVCGIDSPIDTRFTAPLAADTTNTGYPGSDFILDPATVTGTGTLLYDRIISDASGIGNTTQANTAARHCRVELRRNSDGYVYATGETADDGTFSVTGFGLPAATPGSIVLLAQNAACRVAATPSGATTSWTLDNAFSFTSNTNLGTRTLTAATDANGDTRAALHVARTCYATYQWASTRTAATIPQVETLLHPASTAATSYQPAGVSPASLRIASRAASNPDSWDDAMITKAYGRHVLAAIAGAPSTAYDDHFDAVSDEQNAFAEGFGYWLWAVVSETSQAIDGTSANSAAVHDLESPDVTVPKGPGVAGCVAGALYDLLDSANETGDTVDGTLTQERVFTTADTLTVAPKVDTFLQAWLDAGYDGVAITRGFATSGALADDVFEPNDDRTEAPSAGTVGFLPKTLVLNRFNDDWVSVTLPAAAVALGADAKYDKFTTGADLALEIRDQGGTLLASGTYIAGAGALHAATGAVPAGTYRVGVRHLSGGTVQAYVLQVFVPPTMDTKPVRDWTIGRPYDLPLGVADGIAPYTLVTTSGAMPPGMGLNPETLRGTGTPTTLGAFPLTIELRDSGDPVNVISRSETVTIHDVLKIGVAPYVGFPAGRAVEASLPTREGTPPFTLARTSGALPEGLALAPGTFDVTGTADPQPSVTLELDAVDVAGSADHITTRAIVAVAADIPNAPADLAAGDDACGWWFDAVQGSAVSFKAKTAKGRVKRLLTGAVLAPDRSEVLTAKVKGKLGGVSVSRLVCPLSGRYCVIAASDAGEATQLLGSVGVKPPKSGKAKLVDFAPTATTEIEVGALPSATLTLKFKGDKKQQLTPKVVSVTKPDGTPVVFGGNVVVDGFNATLTMTLPEGGTWTIVVGATSATGTPGKLSYSYKLAQPKDAAYSAD